MEVHFTPELEAKLVDAASEQGRTPEDVVQEALARYFEADAHFIKAVQRGEDALQQGDYLTHEQVGKRLQRFLRL